MAIIYIPNHLYPTPSASGKNTCYTSCTPSHNRRQTFTFIHSIAKPQENATNFFNLLPLLFAATNSSSATLCTFYYIQMFQNYHAKFLFYVFHSLFLKSNVIFLFLSSCFRSHLHTFMEQRPCIFKTQPKYKFIISRTIT